LSTDIFFIVLEDLRGQQAVAAAGYVVFGERAVLFAGQMQRVIVDVGVTYGRNKIQSL